MPSNRILIIGAGVAGLALAQGLKKSGIKFAVFERDALLDSRLQGYRLKLAGDIQRKLKELITDEAWAEFEATRAVTVLGETTVNATDAGIMACRSKQLPEGVPLPYTIDRAMLRRALTRGIEEHVHFGKQFSNYEYSTGDERVKAIFADGSVEEGSLLVGTDGMRSNVRKQLVPDYPFIDTQSCCIYGKSTLTPELRERFPEAHRRWITVIRDSTPILQSIISGEAPRSLVTEPVVFSHRDSHSDLPDDYIHWGILFLAKDDVMPITDDLLQHRPVELSLALTRDWHPSVRSLIELQNQDHTAGMRVYSAPPDLPSWTTCERVTVLGDAVHVMSPSGGVGAVAAVHDSYALVNILKEDGISVSSISKFEDQMRAFSSVCLERSFRAGDRLIKAPFANECKTVNL